MEKMSKLMYSASVVVMIAGLIILFKSQMTFEGTFTFALFWTISVTFLLFGFVLDLSEEVNELKKECERPAEQS